MMTPNVEVARPDMPLWEAAELMRRSNVGSLPVCDGRRVVGMVTDRDITIRATADALDPRVARVGQCMTIELVYCLEDQDSADAELMMQNAHVRRLPVLDHDRNLVGIVSLDDFTARTVETEEIEPRLSKASLPGAHPAPAGIASQAATWLGDA